MSKKQKKILVLAGAFALAFGIVPNVSAMHIMEGYLPGSFCIAWGVLCVPFLIAGFMSIKKTLNEHRNLITMLAMSGAFIFVISSLKIPSVTGSCSHMTGTGLGAILFGPAAVSILGLIVLLFQAILLAHGGLTTLGANTFSMAIAGPFVSYGIYVLCKKMNVNKRVAVFLAAALDPRHTTMVNHIVEQLTEQGITVLMATHDVNYAYEWADEVMLFHEGKVLMQGTPAQVFGNRGALKKTNLETPAVLELFESLCKKGILKASLPLPRNLKTLETYISDINLNPHYGGNNIVTENRKKAILAVSFGTSHHDTCKVTIDAIEKEMQAAFPDYPLYRAWTSKMIIRKLKDRDQIHVNTVKEAMEQMRRDGITDVLIQPTHVINGIENDLMKEDALSYREDFHSISFGDPLLTSEQDSLDVIQAIADEFSSLKEDQVLVLMGHGTTHFSNSIYAALDYTFKDKGYSNIFLGTVEAYPSMETLLKMIRSYQPSKVILAPFMIVAGDHAKNDMAGDDPESWYSQFKSAGYEVEPVLKGLGEYSGIRKILVKHLSRLDVQ